MAEDLDAIHLRACGCDEWHADPADTEPVRSLMEHVVEPLLERLGTVEPETVVEHAVMMSGGGMHVRNDRPEVERIYPLAKWIGHMRWHKVTVFRREITIVEDWAEVEPASVVDGAR